MKPKVDIRNCRPSDSLLPDAYLDDISLFIKARYSVPTEACWRANAYKTYDPSISHVVDMQP